MNKAHFLFTEKNTIFKTSYYIKEVMSDPQGLKYTKLKKIYEKDSIRIVK